MAGLALPAAALGQEAAPVAAPPAIGIGALPRDLSPWSMFLSADIVVQAVMVGLAVASVMVWSIWLAKRVELWSATRRLRRGLAALAATRSLAEACEHAGAGRGILPALVSSAGAEVDLSAGLADRSGIKERVAARLARVEVAASREMNRGTGLIATVAAAAPFVGLFGTVWGIMNSFIGISKAQSTNLAIVAPGIAEALLATALGLFAAIPAVILYNQLARATARYRALIGDAATEVLNLVSRELDRSAAGRSRTKAAE